MAGVSNSTTFPLSITMTLSKSIMVSNLWAILNTVTSLNAVLITSYIKWSFSLSTDAVASSSITHGAFLNNALATQTNCF